MNQYYDSYTVSKPTTAGSQFDVIKKAKPKTPDSARSEVELPKTQVIVKPGLTDNEILQVYQMNSNVHEHDRERAGVISQSLKFSRQVQRTHPYFNKTLIKEPTVPLDPQNMYELGQLSEDAYLKHQEFKE